MADVKQVNMEIPAMEIIEQEKKYDKKKILYAVAGCVVGYVIGYKYNDYLIGRGLDKMFEVNPELKDNMWDTICTILKSK